MEDNKDRIEELEKNIATWQEELDSVWNGKNTDSAEVERRNLKNLINNAKSEIDKLKGITKTDENEQDPKELLEQLKKEKETKAKEKAKLEKHLERLEEERENYKSKKNTSYREIYEEYTAQIDDIKEKLEKMEKEEKEAEVKDAEIKVLTKGRMDVEKEIKEIQKHIRKKQEEISEIEYGTDGAMEEKKLSDGTIVKVPKINRLYQEMDELNKKLKEKENLRDEFQKYIDEIKGIEKGEKTEYTKQQNQEYTKFFHGQGDISENARDDKRANDEYFGFEENKRNSKNEGLKDPTGKDPTGKDPTGKDPTGKDPTGKDPTGKDPTGKDPTGKDPTGNLPIRSFWEIYNDTCTQHVGSIAHNINKLSHMKILPAKDEDTLHKVLNVPLTVFKLPVKVLAKIPNAVMGTDRKIEEMQENIDNLSPEEFQVLVQSPEEVNKMFDAHVKDTFDRDYLDPQFMKQYKVNNAYLDVVRSRLGRERENAILYYTEQANDAYERMQELEEVGKDNWTPEQQNEYNQKVEIYQKSVDEGKKWQKELDTFDEGAKKKSSSYRNISGWFLGKFNPDNREENDQMAELSKTRREMAQQGNRNEVNAITGQMQNHARDNTDLIGGIKNYIDRGVYSIESPVETLDRGPQTKGRLLLTNVAVISSAIGLYNQVKDNIFNRQTVEAHNQHLQQINNANKNIQVSGQANVSDSLTASQTEEAITRQTVEAGWNRAERGDLDATNWNLGSQYHLRDAQSHAEGAQVATNADSLLQKGDSLGALKQATDYYSKVQGANRSDITSYISTHPQHDYTAFSFGDSADMSKVYDFFANGVVPYQTNVNGTLAELMPALKEGVDINGVIFTGANALYQAQREGMKDMRKQVRVRPRANEENEQSAQQNQEQPEIQDNHEER